MGGCLNLRFHAPVAAALLGLAQICAAQMMSVREKTYWDLVKQYKGAERKVAVEEIGKWSARDLEAVARVIDGRAKEARKCADCEARQALDALPLRAAVLLHAEADRTARFARLLDYGRSDCSQSAQSLAVEKLLGSVVLQTGGGEFASRFLAAQSLNLRAFLCFASGREWSELGLKSFPTDPGLQVARGLSAESIASVGSPDPIWRTSYDARGRPMSGYEPPDRKEALNAALEAYAKALSLDPGFPGARLRLGRVQWRAGRIAEARESLKLAVSESRGASLYLAHLFYGQCLEDEGDLTGAIAEYTAALDLIRDSQVAAVALAHAHTLNGAADPAREILDRALSFSGKRWTLDPFWSYLAGQQDAAEAILDQLRQEASR